MTTLTHYMQTLPRSSSFVNDVVLLCERFAQVALCWTNRVKTTPPIPVYVPKVAHLSAVVTL